MMYMVIERFTDGNPVPAYRRFRDYGRLMPEGLEYRGSWITHDLRLCYQVMECEDVALLEQWMAKWRDVMDCEVIPVLTSAQAMAVVEPRL